jgi:ABC-2 type transport system ATP-binding protein
MVHMRSYWSLQGQKRYDRAESGVGLGSHSQPEILHTKHHGYRLRATKTDNVRERIGQLCARPPSRGNSLPGIAGGKDLSAPRSSVRSVTHANDDNAIVVKGLTKTYGEVHALAGIDLVVPRGSVLGVLGPNGAGKTTAVKILTTLTRPDSGTAIVDGRDVVADPAGVRRSIGLAGQSAAIVDELTGRENLELMGRLYHLGKRRSKQRAQELLEQFGLLDAAGRRAKTYSGGMARRLDLAASLVAQPRVLFLDEPTTGLDPRARNDMWQVIRELVAGGTTLLLTTQYLEEADELADNIVVFDHGQVIAEGTSDYLKDTVGGDVVEFTTGDEAGRPAALAAVRDLQGAEAKLTDEGMISVRAGDRGSDRLVEVVRRLDDAGIRPQGLGLRRPSLDDVFLALTGHAAEPTAPAADDNEVVSA